MKTARLLPLKDDIDLDEAEDARRTENPRDYPRGKITARELMHVKQMERKAILKGLIMEKSINIINGFRGSGKSWLALAIADEVTWGGAVGPWDVVRPMNVMLVDGEMPLALLQERFKMVNKGRDVEDKPAQLHVYAEAYAYRIGLKRASILDPAWREFVLEAVERDKTELLILDNLSSLAPGIDENDKMAFDPVNRWMLELRFNGVAIVMTHHTGKSGEQRGTTAHEDHVDLALLLSKPAGYKQDQGCKFTCTATKDRAYVTRGNKFTLQLVEGEEGRMEFALTADGGKGAALLSEDMTWEEARDKLSISRATYFRMKQRARGQSHRRETGLET